MFSPQLNEAKYNFLSADINKCGGKGNGVDVAFFARENSNLKRKIQKKAGKCSNRHWFIKKWKAGPLRGLLLLNYYYAIAARAYCYYCAIAMNYELECTGV